MSTFIVIWITCGVALLAMRARQIYRRYRRNQVLDLILQAVENKRLAVASAEFRRSETPSRGAFCGVLEAVFDRRCLRVESYYEDNRSVVPLSLEVQLDHQCLKWDYRPPCRDYDHRQIHFLARLDTYVQRKGFSKIIAYNPRSP